MKPRSLRTSDLLIAVFLILITAMLVLPLPTWLLDFLLVINLAFAVLLLLAGLYMSSALALLSFPSLLLLTTLFRLGLNVASARLILSQGDAGRVIQSFGSFLISGEVVVGVIIFLIITVVNFIVVARGATRVSEVAARFALDALPGKQLSIDSDLRSGLISPEQAQAHREDLRKESQLYGAMDGAMKFVQGDAIAGLFIIATNIIGGMYLGIRSGMSFSEAIDTYTVLTVGDGLVNQIPAILISICAGIVVTRVSSSENSSLGADVQTQVFMKPGALLCAGGLMTLIGILPNLPHLPFIVVGMVLIGTGLFQARATGQWSQSSGAVSDLRALPAMQLETLSAGEEEDFGMVCEVHLDVGALYPQYTERAQEYHRYWETLQTDVYGEFGLQLPALRVAPDTNLNRAHYRVTLNGADVDRGELFPGTWMVELSPASAEAFGFDIEREVVHPLSGSTVVWVQQDIHARAIAEAAGIRIFEGLEFLGLRVAAFVRSHPEEVLGVAEVLVLQQQLEKRHPGLLAQTLNQEFFTPARFSELLHALVREGVSVKDFRHIVESVASYAATVGASLVQEGDFDLEDIVSHIRLDRRRQVLARHLSTRRTLKVITMSDEVANLFEQVTEEGTSQGLVFAPEIGQRLREGLAELLNPILSRGMSPVSLLCRQDLRARAGRFLRALRAFPGVISFQELDPSVVVEPVGVWRV